LTSAIEIRRKTPKSFYFLVDELEIFEKSFIDSKNFEEIISYRIEKLDLDYFL